MKMKTKSDITFKEIFDKFKKFFGESYIILLSKSKEDAVVTQIDSDEEDDHCICIVMAHERKYLETSLESLNDVSEMFLIKGKNGKVLFDKVRMRKNKKDNFVFVCVVAFKNKKQAMRN